MSEFADPIAQAEQILALAEIDMRHEEHIARRGRPMYYDKAGRPMKPSEWYGTPRVRRKSHIGNDFIFWLGTNRHIQVSTIWLGLDHSFGYSRPLIFETMIFMQPGLDGHPLDGYMMRYPTLRDARRGHKMILRVVQRTLRRKPVIHKGGKP